MKNKRFLRSKILSLRNFFSNWKKVLSLILIILLTAVAFVLIIHFWTANTYSDKKYSYEEIEDVPETKVAIVFGAGLDEEGTGAFLTDRVKTGVELYKAGKVQKLIMSGDNRTQYHDEPTAMINLAKEEGVPDHALQADYAGRRTYDTCLRARKIFKIEEAILITQNFHMDRALYTCDSLGIDVIGVSADRSDYKDQTMYTIRDYFALIKAVWELNVDEPDNVVLGDVIEL
ncbi:MAG: hypothetical protein US52_C0030G0017 [candidate division WS6 bacterium GW2011_GWA2_37_6]|uniref:DUF218 domain-containing protein n=1 Tax=candidate division WS6 bacterium GW2011_GWA2_37_6 TaxID=1619087 RepID=A0A0G0H9Q6_9BACT|nr:MAG: hypothetical protein US52_C0030G0017 [candidate division WS6 bacterium GW2011_GWA2_37_6]